MPAHSMLPPKSPVLVACKPLFGLPLPLLTCFTAVPPCRLDKQPQPAQRLCRRQLLLGARGPAPALALGAAAAAGAGRVTSSAQRVGRAVSQQHSVQQRGLQLRVQALLGQQLSNGLRPKGVLLGWGRSGAGLQGEPGDGGAASERKLVS